LFKWEREHYQAPSRPEQEQQNDDNDTTSNLFFAHQVVHNACATQAILSVLLNDDTISLGPTLQEFRNFTASFPPTLKGEAIGASEEMRMAHNSFARSSAFFFDQEGGSKRVATKDDDVFHFVAYVPKSGRVYELDGLQPGPILLGNANTDTTTTTTNWLQVARNAIQERMEAFATGEIKFNLMAIVQDARVGLRQRLSEGDEDAATALAQEEAKRQAWALENARRKHNFVPLCVEILKCLARTNQLEGLTKEAKERVQAAMQVKYKSKQQDQATTTPTAKKE